MTSRLTLPQKILLGSLGMVSLVTAWSAVRVGWYDFQLMKPRAVVDSWRLGTPPSIKMWGKTLGELKALHAQNSEDPQVVESLGYIYALQATRSREIPELKQALFDEAIAYFRASTKLRPMSPYAWSNLALALHENGEASDEMWAAFDRAIRYGRREIAVQKKLAEIGFAHWSDISETRRNQLREIYSTVQYDNQDQEAMLEIAQRNNVQGLAEAVLAPQ